MLKRILLGVVTVVLGGLVWTLTAFAYSLEGGSWNSINPLYVCITETAGPGGSDGTEAIWYDGLGAWFATSTPFGYSTTCSSNNVGLNDVYYSAVAWDGTHDHSPGHGSNPYSFGWGTLNWYYVHTYSSNAAQSVAAHELGHIVGLAHSTGAKIMNSSTSSRYYTHGVYTPQTDDVNGVNAIY